MPDYAGDGAVVEWLLDGDPAIRWQVMRDLLDEPAVAWEAERRRVIESGWVADLLSRQGPEGDWPKGRWTDSVWTLLLLVAFGLPEGHPAGREPVERLLGRFMPAGEPVDGAFLLRRVDLCHRAFWLGLGAHFLDDDPRLSPLSEAVLAAQLGDGGWNCHMRSRPSTSHGSFHTTFNVLENLRLACSRGAVPERAFRNAEARALEFMLAHRLYRSDKSGEVISERFTHLTYPWHWHYTILRGLDYLRVTPAIRDKRLDDPIQLLLDRRKPNGRWPLQKRIPGTLLVEMERPAARAAGTRCAPSGSSGAAARHFRTMQRLNSPPSRRGEVSGDRGDLGCDLGQLRFVSAVELVHEEPGEADPGDTDLGQARERGSARPHDVDRALDTSDELTDQLVVREPYGEHAIGPRLKVEARASHGLLEQLAAIPLEAQDVDPRVHDDVDARLGRRLTDGA
jgi:hypothetical protein